MGIGRWRIGDCGCVCGEGGGTPGCYEYEFTYSFSSPGTGCNTIVYLIGIHSGDPITGCFPFVGTCGFPVLIDGVLHTSGWVGEACYDHGEFLSSRITGYLLDMSDVTFPDETHVCFPDSYRSGTNTICVVGCDGEPLPGATVVVSSEDESGPFVSPPPLDPDNPDTVTVLVADDTGCITVDVPAGFDSNAPITIKVNAPDQYQETTINTTFNDLASGGGTITPDVGDDFTCCDMNFRQGPVNPSGHDYLPRGKTLLFTTSGAASIDEVWEAIVGCDGTGCALSDELEITGGPPTVNLCTEGEAPWDHWQPPTLGANRVPMLVRIWYDGTDWHCSVTVYHTTARPPRSDFGGCAIDPTLDLPEGWGWIRDDASCDNNADPKLSVPPDPELTYPMGIDPDGGSWYSGATTTITVTNSSYTVNTNNPVSVTFEFDPVDVSVHGGTASMSIVSSITVWQPV